MTDEHDAKTRISDPFETPTVAPGADGSADRNAFPVTDWEKYRFISYIGHGGMGRVYLAEDLRLKRNVALKFLRGDDPTLTERFLREAQAQAGIEHTNVCKVYEAGDAGGKLYIAMQYIDGHTLSRAHTGMTLEQKVAVMRDVAEGVHAAHRTGLIHRDIKPGNIMLERSPEGAWHPYVLDFGLAREVDAEGLTVTGALVGTPRYMAPEQAWGERGLLDRRADIYSIGATLYEMLSGHAPIEGESTMGILKRMLHEEPQDLAKRAPAVPRDLQIIVMKCLEREPQRRYDTAHALAEDLQRFLDGDPVAARPAGVVYRMSRKAKKHKALVAVSALALLAVCVMGILALQSQVNLRRRSEAARRFGQQVERMDAFLRIGREIPAHNTQGEQEAVQRMMRGIESQMKNLGAGEQGPGYYALGRGHLSLDQLEPARTALEKAWNLGYREPEVSYALGLALGKLYQVELQKVDAISNKEEREKRRREAQAALRDPAVQYLKMSRSAETAAPEYAEGLIAFYENRYDQALGRAAEALKRLPWLYEAHLLEGDVHAAMGNGRRNSGEYDAAEAQYAKAEAAYRAAARIGESDVSVYESLLSLQVNRINLALYGKGGDLSPPVKAALSAANLAKAIDPDRAAIPAQVSQIHRMLAEDQFNRGVDPAKALTDAIASAEEALRLDPSNARAYANMGTARELQAELQMYSGADPRATMKQAVKELNKAAALDPKDSYVHNILCIAQNMTGQYGGSHGIDPTAAYDAAIASCKRGLALNPKNTNALINLATGYAYRAYYRSDHGADPSADLQQAEQALLKALEVNPRSAYALNNLGSLYIRRGHYQKDHGADPRPAYEQGLNTLRKVHEVYPDDAFPYFNARDALRGWAEYEWMSGRDPNVQIHQAEENFKKGIERNPRLPGSYVDQARVIEIAIRYQIRKGENPAASVAQARSYVKQALALDPHKPNAIFARGLVSMLEGQWLKKSGRSPQAAWRDAEIDLKQAVKDATDTPENWLALAELYCLRAEDSNAPDDLREGLAAADHALQLNASLARAYLFRARLLELQTKTTGDPAEQNRLTASANEARRKADLINPLLK